MIPQEAILTGTIRTFDLAVRQTVLKRFDQIVHGMADALGCRVETDVKRVTPAVINNDDLALKVTENTPRHLLPDLDLETSPYLTMGAEDMAFMQEKVPGCYFFIGLNNKEKHLDYGHHHPKFDFDEEALVRGAALMAT